MCIHPNVDACIFIFTQNNGSSFYKHRSNPMVIADHINTPGAEINSCRNFYSGTCTVGPGALQHLQTHRDREEARPLWASGWASCTARLVNSVTSAVLIPIN